MGNFLPEKYYEACITYHIVRYWEENYGERIYPFSISQIQEKEKGYDFGYRGNPEKVFYIQYKRPEPISLDWEGGTWRVDIQQLETIIQRNIGGCTYYAFPGFYDAAEWYQGLEKTCFLSADDLFTQLRLMRKLTQKTAVIRKQNWKLRKFQDYFYPGNDYRNALAWEICPEGYLKDLLNLPEGEFLGYGIQRISEDLEWKG